MQYEVNNLLEAASLILEKTTGHTIKIDEQINDETSNGTTITPSDPTPVGGASVAIYDDFSGELSQRPVRPQIEGGALICRHVHESETIVLQAERTSGESRRSDLVCIPIVEGQCRQDMIFPFPNNDDMDTYTTEVYIAKKIEATGEGLSNYEWISLGDCDFVFESADSNAMLTGFNMRVNLSNPAGVPYGIQRTKNAEDTLRLPRHLVFYINGDACLVGQLGQGIFCNEVPYTVLTSDQQPEDRLFVDGFSGPSNNMVDGDWEEAILMLENNAGKTTLTDWIQKHPKSQYGVGVKIQHVSPAPVRYYVAGWYNYDAWREDANCGHTFSIGNDYVDFGDFAQRIVHAGPVYFM